MPGLDLIEADLNRCGDSAASRVGLFLDGVGQLLLSNDPASKNSFLELPASESRLGPDI